MKQYFYPTLIGIITLLIILFSDFVSFAQITPDAAGTVYVKDTATGSGNGSNWANATSDLQGAIDAIGTQKVFVAIGNYNVSATASFVMKNGVKIYGGFAPANDIDDLNDKRILPSLTVNGSVLNGQHTKPVIWNVASAGSRIDSSAILDGFTITNGATTGRGGGIHNESYASPMLRNLVVKNNNTSSFGAGIYNQDSCNAIITNVIVTGNNVNSGPISGGGGICNFGSNPVITNVIITNNTVTTTSDVAMGGGIFNRGSNPVITNTLIAGNTVTRPPGGACYGGGMYNDYYSNVVLTNVTAAYNNSTYATGTGGLKNGYGSTLSVYNSIIWGNQQSGSTITSGGDIKNDGSSVTVKNSITQSYTTGSTSDSNLVATSPLFADSANEDYSLQLISPAINTGSNSYNTAAIDLAGNARINSFTIDMGAYERLVVTPDSNGIVYVDTIAAGAGNGNSWENAVSDLQAAINTAGVQKVFVAIGNYDVPSPNSFVMKNGVSIYGGFDPDNGIDSLHEARILPNHDISEGSILNGKNERPVVWNVAPAGSPINNTAVLDGFTIKNGHTVGATGTSANGGGIHNEYAAPTLMNLVIKENIANNGGAGIYNLNSSPELINVAITENTASNIGGGMVNANSAPSLTNVLIAQNTAATSTGGLFQTGGGTTQLINVTIAGNTPNAINISAGNIAIKNAIIYGGILGTTYAAQRSLIEGHTDTTGGNINPTGITIDNIFVGASIGNYYLTIGSPAINAGNNALFAGLSSGSKDLLGKPRQYGMAIDLGAYEYIILPDVNGIVYVKDTATGAGNGSNWANATANLQEAINANGVQKVFVAAGRYEVPSPNSFVMKNGVAIFGGFDPDNGIDSLNDLRIMMDTSGITGSVLDGKNERPVIWNVFTASTAMDSTARLDGFTITGGLNTGTDYYDGGGGIRNSYASPAISNVVFKNNSAQNGGGILNYFSGPTLTNTAFVGNTATNAGGAILNYSSASTIMDGALIIGNSAYNGGGLSNRYTLSQTFKNLIIKNNTASNAAGGLENVNSSSTVINSLITGNEKSITASGTANPLTFVNTTIARNHAAGAEVSFYSVGGMVSFKNSLVFGSYNGLSQFSAQHSFIESYTDTTGGNIDATGITQAVMFNAPALGDFTLKNTAPVINKGNNTYFIGLDTTAKDLEGLRRLDGPLIDMGAFEFQDSYVLPVKLISFSAAKQNHTSLLEWITTNEKNSKRFEIERSADGSSWAYIGYVNSLAENEISTQKIEYHFIDYTPLTGKNFYRLKQLDFDGHHEYSQVRMVSFDDSRAINVYPNPAGETFTITGLKGDETIALYDVTGRMVQYIKADNAEITITLNNLNAGSYTLRMTGTDESEQSVKLIITK